MNLGYAKLFTGMITDIAKSVSDYKAVKADASYQEAIYGANEKLAKASLDITIKRIEDEKRRTLSSQKVAVAKSGAMFNGSPARVAIETNKRYNMDVATEKFNFKVAQYKNNIKLRELEIRKNAAKYEEIAGIFSSIGGAFAQGASISAGGATSGSSSGGTSSLTTGFSENTPLDLSSAVDMTQSSLFTSNPFL